MKAKAILTAAINVAKEGVEVYDSYCNVKERITNKEDEKRNK